MLWTSPAQIDSLTGKNRPGVVALGDQLHVAVARQSDEKIVHAIYTRGTWTSTTLTHATSRTLGLAAFQGGLACAYVNSSGFVALMTWDHTTGIWTDVVTSSFKANNGLALAEHDGLLYLAFGDNSSSTVLNYCTWNGVDSSFSTVIPVNSATRPTASNSPALASFNGHLYLFFSPSASSEVQLYRFVGPYVSGESFVSLGSVTGAIGNGKALGATSYNDQLVLVMCTGSGVVSAFAWDFARWTALPVASLGTTKGGVGAATFQGALELVTMVTRDGQDQVVRAQGLAGGARPLGATPLWSCGGKAYASTNLSPNLFWGARPFTIEAWINAETLSGTQYILSNASADPGQDPVGLVALALRDGVLSLWFAGRWIEAPDAPLSAADWHHVAATFDGSAVALLLNGTTYAFAQFTLADVQTPAPPSGAVLVGATASAGGVAGIFSGTISRVAVFSAARTELEVNQDQFTRVLPQGSLVALLDFGRATPTDASMHALSISTAGTPTWLAQTNALRLSGAGGLDCAGSAGDTPGDLSFSSGEDMTVATWVLPDANPGAPGTILYRSGQYALAINAGRGVMAQAGGGQTLATANGVLSSTAWSHVALVYQSGQLSVLVNGESYALTATTALGTSGSDHTTIGSRPGGEDPYSGAIATVSLWRRALSHRELVALRAQSPVLLEGLAASYDFFTTSIDDTSVQNPTPALIGGGLALTLVNEVISQQQCAEIEVVGVSVSSPFDREVDLEDLAGWTLPEGQTVAGQRSLNSEQVVWLIKLLLTIVLGFAGILGVSVGSKIAGKLQSYLVKYQGRIIAGLNRYFGTSSKWAQYGDDAVAVLLALASNAPGVAADALIGLIANVILDMLRGLWAEGVLRSMFNIIANNLSWWDFANLILNLAAFLIPGANAAKVASMLIQFAIMAEQLIRLSLEFPRARPVASRATGALAPGAMRVASLEAQLRRA